MKTLTVTAVSTSGFDPDFDNVKSFEIDDNPFAEGGFGRIYHCRKINGKTFKNPQVIKIFKNNNGSAAHSYKTILGLQAGLVKKKRELDAYGIDFLDYYPAFFGAPQFVFEGMLDGNVVQGYSANNLKSFGYSCFSDVIEQDDVAERYDQISFNNRCAKAYHMMRAFTLLNEIRYIHADFKSDNFFVSMNDDGRCALIDFDSGAIINDINDETFTVGTPSQNMLAPEIRRQLNASQHALVNLRTDVWSVAVASHYLLFIMHPFDMLDEVSDNSISQYNARFTWPDIDDSFPYYSKDNEAMIEYHNDVCSQLPKDLVDCFRYTFAKGYFEPVFRTSYSQWCMKLKSMLPEGEERLELSKLIRHKERETEEKVWQSCHDKAGYAAYLQQYPSGRFAGEAHDMIAKIEHEEKLMVKPEDFPDYISQLVVDIIRKKTFMADHNAELTKIGTQLNISDLDKKVLNFVTTYYDIWADGVITNVERNKFMFLGKMLKVKSETIEQLLKQKI